MAKCKAGQVYDIKVKECRPLNKREKKILRESDKQRVKEGTIKGAATGGMAGGVFGGPPGAVAGTIVGGLAGRASAKLKIKKDIKQSKAMGGIGRGYKKKKKK